METNLHIGTCSWKYDSWQDIIYPKNKPFNYLQEYSNHYNCVEVDQWFWSLFARDKVVLPQASVVQEYADSVPDDFLFCIKVPNSITLSHYYQKKKSDPLVANPYFLSVELMEKFLESLKPLFGNIGLLMFQFEYLNKQKMAGGLSQFLDLLGVFAQQLPGDFKYFVEPRNPNFLTARYFDFLNKVGLHHIFLQGYYMPSIFELYRNYKKQIEGSTVIRLHGPDRKGIEQQTDKDWSRLVAPKDKDITELVGMLADLKSRNVESFIFVNNHFEGSAPRTITRINNKISA